MPVGLVSDIEFIKELERLSGRTSRPVSPDQSVPTVVDISPEHGRNKGDLNVPDSLRQIIGEEAVINGRASALSIAKEFGISSSSVSAYAKGATSTTTYHEAKPSIISHINKSRVRATKKASHVLNSALSAISQDKLDYTDAKDLSGIAKDMSVIIKNLEPQNVQSESDSNSKTPQFVIYAPQFKDERSFEFIQVNE
jgi:predicted transcriptional regulator